MTMHERVALTRLPTGVPGLDEVLGGGIAEYSFTIIAGEPGAGKTTLAHQIVFANATRARPALYFTALGEPALKMLRYQQQMAFFDPERVGTAVRMVDLARDVLAGDLEQVLARIVDAVREVDPGIIVVDSFRTIVRPSIAATAEVASFLQRLALHLTSWQATTFLIGEYVETDLRDSPVFTVADSILWLEQYSERTAMVRRLHVRKLRGQAPIPGRHAFQITERGLQVFPRVQRRPASARRAVDAERRCSGVPGLDPLLGGGIPAGDSVLVAGPAGTGKSILGTQFIAAGVRAGERGVLAVFEEHPDEYLDRARALGSDLVPMIRDGEVEMVYLHPLDLSPEEALHAIRAAVERRSARRLVIDSLSGFELALAPTFRDDFRESLYRMVGAMGGSGVTTLMSVEVADAFDRLQFSPHAISFLTENIVMMRYVELEGALRRVLAVVKMRRSAHDPAFVEYAIGPRGLAIRGPLAGYQGMVSGAATRTATTRADHEGLTAREAAVYETLRARGEVTARALAQATERPASEITRALARLVALRYVVAVRNRHKTLYRPVARARPT